MRCRSAIKTIVFILFLLCSILSGRAFCQDDLEKAIARKLDSMAKPIKKSDSYTALTPNDALQSVTIPSGFGGYGSYVFGSIGGVYPQVYQRKPDLIVSGGLCAGDPFKAVNVAAGINMTDVHGFSDFSGNIIISHAISAGSSISAGGLQLFASSRRSDAPMATFYFAFSHAVQSLMSKIDGASKLTYTIGIGNGRFFKKGMDDINNGKGKYGTAIFGSISYEIIRHVNLNAEWSGMNLGITTGLRPFRNLLSIGFGAIGLTRYSGNRPSAVFTVGYPLSLSRR